MAEEYSLSDNVVWMEEMKPMTRRELRHLPATEICKYLYKKILSKALAGDDDLLVVIPGDRYEPWMPLVMENMKHYFPDAQMETGMTKEGNVEFYCYWGRPHQKPKAGEDSVAVQIGVEDDSDSE